MFLLEFHFEPEHGSDNIYLIFLTSSVETRVSLKQRIILWNDYCKLGEIIFPVFLILGNDSGGRAAVRV
jgi:hypothetical protein